MDTVVYQDKRAIVVGSVVIIATIILLLLIIIGIVTFNAYMFVMADNGVQVGAGGDVSLFKRQQNQAAYYRNRNKANEQNVQNEVYTY